jgi:hypothetical protein
MNDELTQSLLTAMEIQTYKGCLIYPYEGRFRLWDKMYDTLELAKAAIDESFLWVEKSLSNERGN